MSRGAAMRLEINFSQCSTPDPVIRTSSLTAPKFLFRDLSCKRENLFELTQAKNDSIIGSLESRQELGLWAAPGTRNRIEKLAKSVLSPFCKICLSVSLSLTLSVWLPSWTGLSPYFCLLRLPPASNTVAEHALEMSSTKNSLCLVLIF